jgi:hypothetical protein
LKAEKKSHKKSIMPTDKLKKELYQLMAQSMAIQSLDVGKRIEMQDKMLSLPVNEMSKIIGILKNEKREMAELHKRAQKEQKETRKLTGMAQSLRDAGKRLDKAFLVAQENIDRNESSRTTENLLDEIDRL